MKVFKDRQTINPSELTVVHEQVEFSRDEERENGIAVSYVTCDFRDKHLVFRMCGRRVGEQISWYLKAPAYTRKELGELWPYRKELFAMMLDRLREMDSVSDFRWGRRSFRNLSIDMTEVQGWQSYQLARARQLLYPVTRRLPGKHSMPPLLLGWLILVVAVWTPNAWLSEQVASWCATACGLCALVALWRDFDRQGRVLRWAEAMAQLSRGKRELTGEWVRTNLRHHSTSFAVTLALALALIVLGLSH